MHRMIDRNYVPQTKQIAKTEPAASATSIAPVSNVEQNGATPNNVDVPANQGQQGFWLTQIEIIVVAAL